VKWPAIVALLIVIFGIAAPAAYHVTKSLNEPEAEPQVPAPIDKPSVWFYERAQVVTKVEVPWGLSGSILEMSDGVPLIDMYYHREDPKHVGLLVLECEHHGRFAISLSRFGNDREIENFSRLWSSVEIGSVIRIAHPQ
jgi:hypothetical protein